MAKAPLKQPDQEANRAIEKKWGKPLTAAGWTAIPNVLFERAQAFPLEPLDIVIILNLAGYWWKAGNDPYPSKASLAAAIGVTPRTIQRRIAAMEKAGFIERIERKTARGGNLTNQYSLKGLIEAAKPFAEEHVAAREARKKESVARATRKRPAKLELVKK
ncbi:TPA: helix-turn-helix domain-containing protein [Pseudomonas aeruginosa]|nr:helix-turn-helix domain-containing protein [Pseudomonas aeruginosa]MBX6583438.1 helix-turn-helix domain-containing protein [Pseudomonas aeruginosa]MBX6631797.1 helix-turn-helix domain-containing protein [Pseudomonas aeruginosa]MCZ9831449.1 helix-turn-helix domain-containing protein [Pseudomonas aeruginosa]OKS22356.1 DNA-binding protein [Pseudomonas aeruginosa]HBO2152773.1 helix-turn-helix domain-containing protein [Pseudomonas aeruginosa]